MSDKPSEMLADRLKQGLELYKNGVAEKIIVSGDHGRTDYDEVRVMKDFLISNGVPSENIFMDAFYVTNMFRFITRNNDLIIVLDIVKLEKHPVYYFVELLEKILNKFKNNID